MKSNQRLWIALLAGATSSVIACASHKPMSYELANARVAYRQAQNSPNSRYVPDKLLAAGQQMQIAEREYREDPGSMDERTAAYVADRMSREVIALGNMAANRKRVAIAEHQYTMALEADRKRLAMEQAQLEQARGQLAQSEADLEAERKARAEAEKKTAEALRNLTEIAKVKEDERGTVVSLQGSVLFRSGESELLPNARTELARVAEALKQSGEKRTIVVEGHTDSRGTEDYNEELSQRRAEAVRLFLVDRGLDPMTISAIGKGESQPIARNTSAEGRANNRRVELVIRAEPSQTAVKPTTP